MVVLIVTVYIIIKYVHLYYKCMLLHVIQAIHNNKNKNNWWIQIIIWVYSFLRS
jgi:hypothetical protein